MTKKVFISYSHKDEEHRQDFEEHLVMLKRREIISLWHDRKITVGEDWKNSIDENLENADIIIFLVSPSFLASDYCYDVEVARAIKRKDEGSCEIISIIVRPCDWIDCEFSRFQAVPKDAKPITIWDDKDSAWLDAINGIKRHIIDFKSKKNTSIIDTVVSPKPSIEVINWVNDTEIILTHRKVNKIKLSSIYVIPDIEIESDSKSEIIKIISASELINNIGCYIVAGEEQQGKTSLLKYFFITLYENALYTTFFISS